MTIGSILGIGRDGNAAKGVIAAGDIDIGKLAAEQTADGCAGGGRDIAGIRIFRMVYRRYSRARILADRRQSGVAGGSWRVVNL